MCGIFGVVQGLPVAAGEILEMGRRLRHRGPDDEGYLLVTNNECQPMAGPETPETVLAAGLPHTPTRRLDADAAYAGRVALGFRRLSILDLSPTGHQPMCYLDRYWIVFNGEIYNYLELQAELKAAGYSFRSRSDTEVLMAAYDCWGPACLNRLNGMWGMAIYDRQRETLFLARDRYGVKPLYLWPSQGRLAFASEIKAFSALEGWAPKGNVPRLLDFLVWTVSDHSSETMFAGIQQLPAGHSLTLNLPTVLAALARNEEPRLAPERYYHPAECRFASDAEAEETFRFLLADAVRLRLRADVPVGSCLSGGLDSSAIVCLMHEHLAAQGFPDGQKTFTAGSAEPAYDETRYARAVIERTGVDGHFVTPEPERLFRDLQGLIWSQDEPFGSGSIFAQWCVFDLARKNDIIVMLDGQGADEILGGYRGYFGAYLAELARNLNLRGVWTEMAQIRANIGFSRARSTGYMLAYLFPGAVGILGRFDGRAYSDRSWLHPSSQWAMASDPIARAGGRRGSVRSMSMAQLSATHLPMLLRYEDRNSMAFSIEARTPFLDYRLVEACLGMHSRLKVGGGLSKAILRKVMRGTVPDPILDRKDKMGFLTADPVWMARTSQEPFRKAIQEAVERFPGVLAPALVDQFDQVGKGERPYDARYWRALNLAMWAQVHGVSC